KPVEALKAYEEAAKLAPEVVELQFWAAVSMYTNDRKPEALKLFRQVFSKEGHWADLVPRLAKAGLFPDDPKQIDEVVSQRPRGRMDRMTSKPHRHLSGPRIDPKPITGKETAADLIDQAFLAYNGARLREGARLLVERMLDDDVTVALSVTGALTPAGLGMSAIIPLMEAGFVDWIVSTGANLYHDTHFGLGLSMHQGTFQADDVELREQGVVRIYDIF